jgi:hypothetical protein
VVSLPPRGRRARGRIRTCGGQLRRLSGVQSPRALGSRGRIRTCDFLLNRQAAFHSRTLKWSLSTDLNGPLPGTGRVRRHQRLRGGSRGPCCTGRQRRGYEPPPGKLCPPSLRNAWGVPSFARHVPSRDGLETLSGFPCQSGLCGESNPVLRCTGPARRPLRFTGTFLAAALEYRSATAV